jgi:hypothetical protein
MVVSSLKANRSSDLSSLLKHWVAIMRQNIPGGMAFRARRLAVFRIMAHRAGAGQSDSRVSCLGGKLVLAKVKCMIHGMEKTAGRLSRSRKKSPLKTAGWNLFPEGR